MWLILIIKEIRQLEEKEKENQIWFNFEIRIFLQVHLRILILTWEKKAILVPFEIIWRGLFRVRISNFNLKIFHGRIERCYSSSIKLAPAEKNYDQKYYLLSFKIYRIYAHELELISSLTSLHILWDLTIRNPHMYFKKIMSENAEKKLMSTYCLSYDLSI